MRKYILIIGILIAIAAVCVTFSIIGQTTMRNQVGNTYFQLTK